MSESDSEQPASPARKQSPPLTRAEWTLILVLVAIQFTHVVDFVIILPLGGRLINELHLTERQFGYIVAVYAWAAGIATLLASFVMDRLDRRTVLISMYAGFGLSTLFCGLASTYELLLLARTFAGVFGGLAAVTLMSVIGDVFPSEKRGRATGAVMSAFAVATIAGIPLGLLLAEWFGRGAPFVVLAGLSGVVWVVALFRLPPVREHLGAERHHPVAEFVAVIREPGHLWAFVFSFFLVFGSFTISSFIAPVWSDQNGWTEKELAVVYLSSGVFTLIGMNVVGRLADRHPRLWLFRMLGGLTIVVALVLCNLPPGPLWVATLVMTVFMVLSAGRMVPAQAMLLGTAAPRVRGAFMSVNTSVQHLGTGLAPIVAGAMLHRTSDGQWTGFPLVGLVGAAAAAVSLVLAGWLRPAPHTAPIPAPATAEPPTRSERETKAEPAAAV